MTRYEMFKWYWSAEGTTFRTLYALVPRVDTYSNIIGWSICRRHLTRVFGPFATEQETMDFIFNFAFTGRL